MRGIQLGLGGPSFSSTATTRSTSKVVVMAAGIQLGAQVIDQMRIGHAFQRRRFVVRLEGFQDVVRVR
jgi:hypothetical protein